MDRSKSQPPDGLGDFVAAAFASVGLTKARAQAVARAVGSRDCGCAQRQERLNAIGRGFLGFGAAKPPPQQAE